VNRITGNDSSKQSKQNYWQSTCIGFDPRTLNFDTSGIYRYFFTINMEQYGWIRNPFSANAEMLT